MESKKFSVYISIIIIIIASIIFKIDYFEIKIDNTIFLLIKDTATINNLCIGVIGSALVTLIIYITEYWVERKKALENYYLEAIKILKDFEKIEYVEISSKSRQLTNYLIGDKKEELENCDIETLIQNYDKNNLFSGYPVELTKEQKLNLIRKDIIDFKNEIIQVMESYMEFSKVSFHYIEIAYGSLSFFFERIRMKIFKKFLKIKIYNNIHIQLKNIIEEIYSQNNYFESYKQGKIKNFNMIVNKIAQLNKQIFEMETKTIDNYEYTYVYRKLEDNIKIELENLRAKIYHQCPAEQKKMPFIIECKNVYTNSKSDEKI